MITITRTPVRRPLCIGDVVELAKRAETAHPEEKADALSAIRAYLVGLPAQQVTAQWNHIATAMEHMNHLEVSYLLAHLAEHAEDPIARFGWQAAAEALAA